MKKKILALFVAFGFVLNIAGAAFADTKTKKQTNQNNQLAALLPASSGVITFDSKRMFNNALPQILSGNPSLLNKIMSQIDGIKTKFGVDVRQFEQVAIGIASKQTSANEYSLEPVILTRGNFNAGGLLAVGKVAANGKYREEKVGDKTIYIFTLPQNADKNISQNNASNAKDSIFDKAIDKIFESLTREIAVAVYDNNTLAIGTPQRVRETFTGKARIGSDLLGLINRKPASILSFAAKFPQGLSPFINLDNDELGNNLDGIRQISGNFDVIGTDSVLELSAKTLKPEQAENLQQTLAGLQSVFTNILLGSKGDDKKVYGRMLKNAEFTQKGSEILLSLKVPQNDIDILLGQIK